MTSLPKIVIVDTETLGLDRTRHAIFEIAAITGDPYDDGSGYTWEEHVWHLNVDPASADPGALRVNNFYQRCAATDDEDTDYCWKIPHRFEKRPWAGRAPRTWREPREAALEVATVVAGRTLIGAVPDFDAYRLEDWLRANGQCGAWDYHLIDVETLVAGYVRGVLRGWASVESDGAPGVFFGDLVEEDIKDISSPKWRSTELLAMVGIEPPEGRHTALVDCRWARDAYCKVFDIPV